MPCVYTTPEGLCKGTAPLHPNEHYLPRALGNFKNNEPLVNRICNDCQLICSNSKTCSPTIAPTRTSVTCWGQLGRKKHAKKDIFYDATFGIPPLAVLGKHPGHDFEMLWEPVEGVDGFAPMSQIFFFPKEGEPVRLPFKVGKWTVEKINAILAKSDVEVASALSFANTEDEEKEMRGLLDTLVPVGKERPVAPLVAGAEIDGEVKAQVSEGYARAIAKIGFHFLLKYFPFTGSEPEFDDVKRFIYTGKYYRPIFTRKDEPALRDLKDPRAFPNRWAHFLSAESDQSGIQARMHLFFGPVVRPIGWSVQISTTQSCHVQSSGSALVYYEDRSGEYQGERVDLIPVPDSYNPHTLSPKVGNILGLIQKFEDFVNESRYIPATAYFRSKVLLGLFQSC